MRNPGPTYLGTALTSEFIMPPRGPGPVMDDPAHPYVSNAIAARTGKVPSFPVEDISNPILQPWAREVVRKHNELALSGKAAYTPQARCWPIGVSAFLLYPVRPASVRYRGRDRTFAPIAPIAAKLDAYCVEHPKVLLFAATSAVVELTAHLGRETQQADNNCPTQDSHAK